MVTPIVSLNRYLNSSLRVMTTIPYNCNIFVQRCSPISDSQLKWKQWPHPTHGPGTQTHSPVLSASSHPGSCLLHPAASFEGVMKEREVQRNVSAKAMGHTGQCGKCLTTENRSEKTPGAPGPHHCTATGRMGRDCFCSGVPPLRLGDPLWGQWGRPLQHPWPRPARYQKEPLP